MPRIEMLPEKYWPDITTFTNSNPRYYIVNYFEKEVAKVYKDRLSGKIVIHFAGSNLDGSPLSNMKFIARIYLED